MEISEQELVASLKAGREEAYGVLVRTHGGRLLAVARRYLSDSEDARDAVQEAFISAFRAIGRFESGSLLSTWLHRIVINVCLMKLRSKRHAREESMEDLLPRWLDDGHHMEPPAHWQETSDETLHRKETRAIVRNCIEKLPDSYRTILLLRDIDEIDTKETARLLGLTEGGAKVRLHRARQALRTLLDERFGAVMS